MQTHTQNCMFFIVLKLHSTLIVHAFKSEQSRPLETTLLHGIFQAVLLYGQGAGTKMLPGPKKSCDQIQQKLERGRDLGHTREKSVEGG